MGIDIQNNVNIQNYINKAKLLGYEIRKMNDWISILYLASKSKYIQFEKTILEDKTVETNRLTTFNIILTKLNMVINNLHKLEYGDRFLRMIGGELEGKSEVYIVSDLGKMIELNKYIKITRDFDLEFMCTSQLNEYSLDTNLIMIRAITKFSEDPRELLLMNRKGKMMLIFKDTKDLSFQYDIGAKKSNGEYTNVCKIHDVVNGNKVRICTISESLNVINSSINKDFVRNIKFIKLN